MDTSAPGILFNLDGICSYCSNYFENIKPYWNSLKNDSNKLERLSEEIKNRSKGNEFDCIIGISGGLDSSYAAYIAKNIMGLNPLLIHVDAGWNTSQAVKNIENLVDGLGLELYTEVVNWKLVKEMQLCFFKSGIPDQDLVQDAAFFSGLYTFAYKYKIKNIITGSNFLTECCREPEEWGGYLGLDVSLFKDIWHKHGKNSEGFNFPIIDILKYKIVYQKLFGFRVYHPLNYISYSKKEAEHELEQKFNWKPFQHKHHESRFTRFYEDYWLPKRFGFDKRRAHFSSLIMTKQMSRDDAISRIASPEMSELFLRQEFEYVANKLNITPNELRNYFSMPHKTFRDFKNKRDLIRLGARLMQVFGDEKRFFG